jgi:hypothetical protein
VGRCTIGIFLLAALAHGEEHNGRVFWIIPNGRSTALENADRPLTASEKFKLARQDSLDPGAFALAAIFAAKGQALDTNPSFGQGVGGFAKRFGASYADWAIGYHMTEAVFPTLLHQDPRYFRKGSGGGWSRLGHAMAQTFRARSDSGRPMFNWSELGGDATAVAISQAYYPDQRTAGAAAGKLGIYLGLTTASNILKEFWPDIQRKVRPGK